MSAQPNDVTQPVFQIDDILGKYLELRDEKDRIQAELKAKVKGLDDNMGVIETWLLNEFNTRGATNIATPFATAFVKDTDFANVSDWNVTLEFIKTHELWQMLKKDVLKSAVKEFIDATGTPPPGVNWGSKREVQVRRK